MFSPVPQKQRNSAILASPLESDLCGYLTQNHKEGFSAYTIPGAEKTLQIKILIMRPSLVLDPELSTLN